MGIFDQIQGLLGKVNQGQASDQEVHQAYDQVSPTVPQGTLAQDLAHTLRSDETPPFEQTVSKVYDQSDPQQKAGLLNTLLGAIGGQGNISQALNAAGASGLAGMLSGGRVSPQQAQQVNAQTVEKLAQHANEKNPSVVDRASEFYAQHPGLVKAAGAGVLAVLVSRMSARH